MWHYRPARNLLLPWLLCAGVLPKSIHSPLHPGINSTQNRTMQQSPQPRSGLLRLPFLHSRAVWRDWLQRQPQATHHLGQRISRVRACQPSSNQFISPGHCSHRNLHNKTKMVSIRLFRSSGATTRAVTNKTIRLFCSRPARLSTAAHNDDPLAHWQIASRTHSHAQAIAAAQLPGCLLPGSVSVALR